MIYTVGLREKYEPRIDSGTALKAGPHPDAQGKHQNGGWVWRTAAEARAFLQSRKGGAEREVYAVMAEWELDTVTVPGEPTRCLTRDALVFRVAPGTG
ncbi:MAG: hypothetical protein WDM94_07725 [Bauldia sp.]